MKNIFSKLVATARRTYEQRVDSVVDVITQRAFPVQVYFLKDGLAIGILRIGSAKATLDEIAPPGTLPTFAVKADDPMALFLLQRVLALTPLGHIPRGVIRDAVREAWRRKFNQLQLEEMQVRINAAKAANATHGDADNLETASILASLESEIRRRVGDLVAEQSKLLDASELECARHPLELATGGELDSHGEEWGLPRFNDGVGDVPGRIVESDASYRARILKFIQAPLYDGKTQKG